MLSSEWEWVGKYKNMYIETSGNQKMQKLIAESIILII